MYFVYNIHVKIYYTVFFKNSSSTFGVFFSVTPAVFHHQKCLARFDFPFSKIIQFPDSLHCSIKHFCNIPQSIPGLYHIAYDSRQFFQLDVYKRQGQADACTGKRCSHPGTHNSKSWYQKCIENHIQHTHDCIQDTWCRCV